MAGGALATAEKGASEKGQRIVFVDETGCYLLPMAVRTHAPRGQTPVLREWATREHLSAISGVTPEGQLYVQARDHALRGADAARFLQHLVWHLSPRLLVIWDGSPIHRSKEVKAFLASPQGQDVQLERLPAYAPDLNPDEGVWQLLKGVELKNVACAHLPHLFREFWKAVKRLRAKPWLLRSCFLEPGLV